MTDLAKNAKHITSLVRSHKPIEHKFGNKEGIAAHSGILPYAYTVFATTGGLITKVEKDKTASDNEFHKIDLWEDEPVRLMILPNSGLSTHIETDRGITNYFKTLREVFDKADDTTFISSQVDPNDLIRVNADPANVYKNVLILFVENSYDPILNDSTIIEIMDWCDIIYDVCKTNDISHLALQDGQVQFCGTFDEATSKKIYDSMCRTTLRNTRWPHLDSHDLNDFAGMTMLIHTFVNPRLVSSTINGVANVFAQDDPLCTNDEILYTLRNTLWNEPCPISIAKAKLDLDDTDNAYAVIRLKWAIEYLESLEDETGISFCMPKDTKFIERKTPEALFSEYVAFLRKLTDASTGYYDGPIQPINDTEPGNTIQTWGEKMGIFKVLA